MRYRGRPRLAWPGSPPAHGLAAFRAGRRRAPRCRPRSRPAPCPSGSATSVRARIRLQHLPRTAGAGARAGRGRPAADRTAERPACASRRLPGRLLPAGRRCVSFASSRGPGTARASPGRCGIRSSRTRSGSRRDALLERDVEPVRPGPELPPPAGHALGVASGGAPPGRGDSRWDAPILSKARASGAHHEDVHREAARGGSTRSARPPPCPAAEATRRSRSVPSSQQRTRAAAREWAVDVPRHATHPSPRRVADGLDQRGPGDPPWGDEHRNDSHLDRGRPGGRGPPDASARRAVNGEAFPASAPPLGRRPPPARQRVRGSAAGRRSRRATRARARRGGRPSPARPGSSRGAGAGRTGRAGARGRPRGGHPPETPTASARAAQASDSSAKRLVAAGRRSRAPPRCRSWP